MASFSFFDIVYSLIVAILAWTCYGVIWRLYTSPVAHIPGPKLAALTYWYEFYYDAMLPGKYVFKIQELHKTYGPILRISPTELHIDDPGFLNTVYAPSQIRRDKYEYQLRTLRLSTAVGTTTDYNLHKKRREALSPFFSKRNVLYLEPVITEKVKQLCGVIKSHAQRETPVNLSDVFFAFSCDVVTNFLFAQQSNLLADEQRAATLRSNSNGLLLGIKVNQHFPWLIDFMEALPQSISKPIKPPGLVDMENNSARVRSELEQIVAEKNDSSDSNALPNTINKEKSVFHTLLDSKVLSPSDRAMSRLEQEGSLLQLAGSESPAKTLTILWYHLLANPTIMATLRRELSSVPKDATWSSLEQLPYLSAVIEEGNRLSFGVTARLARIAPEPLAYTPSELTKSNGKAVTIPAGTPVSITTLSAHTNEIIFPDPYTFDPDRWLGIEGTERRKYQMAFNKGGRKCIGMDLARAELYLTVAALAVEVDMTLFETNHDDVAFLHDYQVAMPKLDSKGIRATVKARGD